MLTTWLTPLMVSSSSSSTVWKGGNGIIPSTGQRAGENGRLVFLISILRPGLRQPHWNEIISERLLLLLLFSFCLQHAMLTATRENHIHFVCLFVRIFELAGCWQDLVFCIARVG